MELKDSEELRQLEAAWRSLMDLTNSWDQQLQLANRMEDRLAQVETGLKQLELASVEWDLPPSIGNGC
jgi:prefoldin subunit 5